jgi:protein O-GlcNAc transferase
MGAVDAPTSPAAAPTVMTTVEAYNRAVHAYQTGGIAMAFALCESILRSQPEHPETLHLLGILHLGQGNPAAAERAIEAALRRKRTAPMLANHGFALLALGRSTEALAAQQAAVALEPGNPNWRYNVGIALQTMGSADEATAAFRAATAVDPSYANAHNALGRLLFGAGRPAEAVAAFQAALCGDPAGTEALTGLGVSLTHASRPDEGVTAHERALRLDPGRLDDAVHTLDHARAGMRFDLIESARDRLANALAASVDRTEWRLLASILYRDLYRPLPNALRTRTQAVLDTRLAATPTIPAPPAASRTDGGRLRVGYLSSYLKNHPIGQVSLSTFAAHDRAAVEVHGLLRAAADPAQDPYAARHRQGFDQVHDLSGLPPPEAARRIAALGLDVLVYLDGYMDKDGLEILALRPAPVRVYWLGHAGGIGRACADYLLADRIVIPPGEEELYSEHVVRLPGCYHCADRHLVAPRAPSRHDQGLPDDAFVFCGFNNVEKIDFSAFRLWMSILRQIDGSVLWLQGSERPATNLRRFAAELGVDPDRLVFAGRVTDKSLHLARYRLADLFLDTWTMNASTTALDALWAGLPMVALAGDHFANRISNSMLAAIGMADLVCPTPAAYESLAVAFARNPQILANFTNRLHANRETTLLFDTVRFARTLEAAYRRMVKRQRAGLPPEGFDLEGAR